MEVAEAVTGQAQRHEGGRRASAWKNIHTAKAGQGPEVTQTPGSRVGGGHAPGGHAPERGLPTPPASEIRPEGMERVFTGVLVPETRVNWCRVGTRRQEAHGLFE